LLEGDKMYCWKCGKKNHEKSRFCNNCGANLEGEKAPGPEGELKPTEKKRSRGKLLVILILLIIIFASISIFFFFSYESVNKHVYYTYNPKTTPTSLEIDFEMENGGVEIEFTSDLNEPLVYIDYHKRWDGFVVREPSFSTSSNKVSFRGAEVWGEANSELKIILRNDVTYDFKGKERNGGLSFNSNIPGLKFGSFNFDTYNGGTNLNLNDATISGKIRMKSENGGSNIFLTNCTASNIEIDSESGGFGLTFTDSRVSSDSTWDINSKESGISLNIIQSIPLGANVTVDAHVKKGKISVNFEGNSSHLRARFDCEASGGDITLNKGVEF
jgi:hypothetical protein